MLGYSLCLVERYNLLDASRMQDRSQVHSLVWSSSCGNRQGFAGRLQCGILCPSPKAVACEVNLMQADLSESSAVI